MHGARFSLTANDLVVHSIHAMAAGERAEFEEMYAPDALDRENVVQPRASRVPGPAGFWATAQWLRTAFADLRYDIHHVMSDGDLVTVNSTMLGRHVSAIAFHTPDGAIDAVFPPTGRPFAMAQAHWFRVRDGLIAEHWAVRDDLGTAKQLGWLPPTPAYLVKMAWAKRLAARA
ncbi:ester cyclase [Kutzneria sp. NPDC051319]|uniref:ester cyclase n=1 Tax=Kutzneria sp. NPDC051319 TaxID=3155047 RepID=UPI0034475BC6